MLMLAAEVVQKTTTWPDVIKFACAALVIGAIVIALILKD